MTISITLTCKKKILNISNYRLYWIVQIRSSISPFICSNHELKERLFITPVADRLYARVQPASDWPETKVWNPLAPLICSRARMSRPSLLSPSGSDMRPTIFLWLSFIRCSFYEDGRPYFCCSCLCADRLERRVELPVPLSAGCASTIRPNWPWQLLSGGKKT